MDGSEGDTSERVHTLSVAAYLLCWALLRWYQKLRCHAAHQQARQSLEGSVHLCPSLSVEAGVFGADCVERGRRKGSEEGASLTTTDPCSAAGARPYLSYSPSYSKPRKRESVTAKDYLQLREASETEHSSVKRRRTPDVDPELSLRAADLCSVEIEPCIVHPQETRNSLHSPTLEFIDKTDPKTNSASQVHSPDAFSIDVEFFQDETQSNGIKTNCKVQKDSLAPSNPSYTNYIKDAALECTDSKNIVASVSKANDTTPAKKPDLGIGASACTVDVYRFPVQSEGSPSEQVSESPPQVCPHGTKPSRDGAVVSDGEGVTERNKRPGTVNEIASSITFAQGISFSKEREGRLACSGSDQVESEKFPENNIVDSFLNHYLMDNEVEASNSPNNSSNSVTEKLFDNFPQVEFLNNLTNHKKELEYEDFSHEVEIVRRASRAESSPVLSSRRKPACRHKSGTYFGN
ncbi:uncharacterized protein LOC129457253 [Periophthalmus magnuspinnatus]|uniref:uncharacterized protein LOC129457253 n=1 Tax=Periophthalmus magnuspinnatus TaxID=409849 RepID=UPI00243719C9|nr:uncharacterized protein LOC129457253 [Periophthalmus magnuspinnatus]